MTIFFLCAGLLVAGYFTYGVLVERIFGVDCRRPTPAVTRADGVDYVRMPPWKVFLIQLLDIAGIGPIFGPIMAALYGPAALLWIVFGSIFAGAVHDFFSGMISLRYNGENLPEIARHTIGGKARILTLIFSLLLLLLVGVVFVLSPAAMLSNLTGGNQRLFVGLIFGYYFLATIMPIDKVIGRLYPIFGGLLLFMAIGILWGLVGGGHVLLPHIGSLQNTHPENLPLWPLMFITLSCGAISGFHSTQSPIMSRCIGSERQGRMVFYGAMIAEGIIALIWATAALSLYEPARLDAILKSGTASMVVNETALKLLGRWGGFLAILGVIIFPITSGDTAFRSARLIVAEFLRLPQADIFKRLVVAVPLFAVGFLISRYDFGVIWRYFGWSNQTLAALVLWIAAVYLAQHEKPHWIASVPAVFLTAVSFTFILYAKIGLALPYHVAVATGLLCTTVITVVFLRWSFRRRR